jgi:hypothetical protein
VRTLHWPVHFIRCSHPTSAVRLCEDDRLVSSARNRLFRTGSFDVFAVRLFHRFDGFEQILRIELSEHLLSRSHQERLANWTRRMLSSVPSQLTADVSVPLRDKHAEQINELTQRLIHDVQTLDNELTRVRHESTLQYGVLHANIDGLSTMKRSIDETTNALDRLRSQQEMIAGDFASAKANADRLGLVSHDGTFIWKITDVQAIIGLLFASLGQLSSSRRLRSDTQISGRARLSTRNSDTARALSKATHRTRRCHQQIE